MFVGRQPAAGTRAREGAGGGAGPGLHPKLQPQGVQERDQGVQLHGAFALLDEPDEAFGDSCEFGQFTLAQAERSAPGPDPGGELVRKRVPHGRLPWSKYARMNART